MNFIKMLKDLDDFAFEVYYLRQNMSHNSSENFYTLPLGNFQVPFGIFLEHFKKETPIRWRYKVCFVIEWNSGGFF